MSGLDFRWSFILASASPRRKELLKAMGFDFEIRHPNTEEVSRNDLAPEILATRNASLKANAVGEINAENLVIGADTVVGLNNRILGKPANASDAFDMLKALSGETHRVVTGVCFRTLDKSIEFHESTQVTFTALSDELIDRYIVDCEPFDKAGAYAIQEWIGMVAVKRIEGDYYNIVGLPLSRIYRELAQIPV